MRGADFGNARGGAVGARWAAPAAAAAAAAEAAAEGPILLIARAVPPVLDSIITPALKIRVPRYLSPLLALLVDKTGDQLAFFRLDREVENEAWSQLLEPSFAALLGIALALAGSADHAGNLGPQLLRVGQVLAQRRFERLHNETAFRHRPAMNVVGHGTFSLCATAVVALVLSAPLVRARHLDAFVSAA